jgi:hypothetical protein
MAKILECKEIVIGNSLKALLFSIYNNYLFFKTSEPDLFGYYNIELPLNLNPYGNNCVKLAGGEDRIVGPAKEPCYSRLFLFASLAGLTPFSEKIETLNFSGDSSLQVHLRNNKSWKVKFRKCFIFEDNNLRGLGVPEKVLDKDMIKVYDIFSIYGKNFSGVDILEVGEEFVSNIYFFKNPRSHALRNRKDLVIESRFSKENLTKFEYSETFCRFKATHILSEYFELKESFRMLHTQRVIFNEQKNLYKDMENIVFLDTPIDEIIDSRIGNQYVTRLMDEL